MQLRVMIPVGDSYGVNSDNDVMVSSETDIRTAGFAAARAVRTWLRQMPFVPTTGDLHFNIYAEVVQEPAKKIVEQKIGAGTLPKGKKKARK